jgi:hypothetical protein
MSASGKASLRARIAAHERWAHTKDRQAATAPARAGLDARFAEQVDPDGTLDPAERDKRVRAKRKAHFARLALLSAESRGKAAVARQAAADARELRRAAAELRQAADELESRAAQPPSRDDADA